MSLLRERSETSEDRTRLQEARVALVHDWLVTLGGADRVLLALHGIFPRAPVHTTLFEPARLPRAFHHMDVRPSWLQRIPQAASRHRWLVPLMPFAVRSFDLAEYDVVISSSHSCAKGVRPRAGALHICYCHTPMRYVWDVDLRKAYLNAMPPAARAIASMAMQALRRWDAQTAPRVDYFIANSEFVAGRIRRFYDRSAEVIHPPVDVEFFTPDGAVEEFYLVVSRLVPYKRVDLAVEAFTRLGLPLVVVGDGPEAARLRARAGATVRFAGEVSEAALRGYYRRCRALVFPGIEDFGLVPLEAQACGRPVIAYAEGGVLESVRDGDTGLFFRDHTATSLMDAVRTFERHRFDPRAARANAEAFSTSAFQQRITAFVERCVEEKRPSQADPGQ